MTAIGSSAFNKKPIKTFWFPNTQPSGYSQAVGTVNDVANDNYSSLTNMAVYKNLSSLFEVDGVKYVPVSAERSCYAIDCDYGNTAATINIGESVSYRGVALAMKGVKSYTFYDNDSIVSANIDNEGVLESHAFHGCSALENITLGDKITKLEASVFQNCRNLLSFAIPESITSIGSSCFENSSLTTISIPMNVTTINDNVFAGCTALSDVIIEDRQEVLSLGESPFKNCPLDSIYIGGKITYNRKHRRLSGCRPVARFLLHQWQCGRN